jgi:2-methylcitrate dehydratase PrpD
VLDGLGERYAIEEGLIFKAYPCCGANHYAIDATIALLREAGLGEPDVASIDIWIERRNLEDVLVYPWPRTPLEGKFSLAYNVAAALLDGEVTVDTFTEPALQRLASVRGKVTVHASTDLPQNGARINVVTTDGRTLAREQLILRGSIEDPMSWAELERKFRTNVRSRIAPDAVGEVLGAIADLEQLKSMAAVSTPLLG